MYNSRMPARSELRAALLATARRVLETGGPDALQARKVAAEAGTSTQAVYTQFGGMPGLLQALTLHGFDEMAETISAVPESDDPVADHLLKGWTYAEWALVNRQLYRLMAGISTGDQRTMAAMTLEAMSAFPEGHKAVSVLHRSVQRMMDANRIRTDDAQLVASQFLAATHGYVMLQIAGAFGDEAAGLAVIGMLAVNLLVGMGDSRTTADASLTTAMQARITTAPPPE
jgi:AcrR family transcriptional regulator